MTATATITAPETLNYVGRNGQGYVYMHHWATGWQELVFPNHEAAARFLASANR